MKLRSKRVNYKAGRSRRNGVVLAAALIAFAVVTATLFAILKGAASHQYELQRELQAIQADYLADAGLQRALARLQRDSSYGGEIWRLSKDTFDGVAAGAVVIEVNLSNGNVATIRSQADYPNDDTYRIRKTKVITLSRNVR